MARKVKTKIICTIGPASSSASILRKMMLCGMDVARLNFSHGGWEEQQEKFDIIQALNKKYRRHIKILQDLEGYRIRIGWLKNHQPIELKKREIIWLTQKNIEAEKNLIPLDYQGSLKNIKRGSFIFIEDGKICLKVLARQKKRLKTQVTIGGLLNERRGVNIPDALLEFPEITEKDKRDIQFGIKNKVDYIAQSFVRGKKDILNIRELVSKEHPECQIIAKIENKEALRNFDEILEVSDGIMIARGDLGVSLPIWQVPILQKEIIGKCRARNKFVITATQMLESMVENPRPTRAEAADVANAVLDGSDFILLSAETSIGKYPRDSVFMANQIIKFTEDSKFYNERK